MNERENETRKDVPPAERDCSPPEPFRPDIRPALEPVCCGSGCDGCPYF
jgi:hypothetical protein